MRHIAYIFDRGSVWPWGANNAPVPPAIVTSPRKAQLNTLTISRVPSGRSSNKIVPRGMRPPPATTASRTPVSKKPPGTSTAVRPPGMKLALSPASLNPGTRRSRSLSGTSMPKTRCPLLTASSTDRAWTVPERSSPRSLDAGPPRGGHFLEPAQLELRRARSLRLGPSTLHCSWGPN